MRSLYKSHSGTFQMLAFALAVCVGFHLGFISTEQASLVGFIGITMNAAGARVIDPVLSEIAQGYRNAEAVGLNLFPVVPVAQRGGKIISFSKEDFALYDTQRAPGANTKRISGGWRVT